MIFILYPLILSVVYVSLIRYIKFLLMKVFVCFSQKEKTMYLSMSMIAKYLEKYTPEVHITDDAQTIRGVRFFTEQPLDYSLDYVYLGKASGYFQDPRYKDALLLAHGQNQILCHGTEYETLLNAVLSAFEFYSHLEQKLYTAAADHKPLQDILNIIGQAISSPIFVFDIDGVLLESVHEENMPADDYMARLSKNSILGSTTIGQIFVDKNGNISHDLTNAPQHLHVLGHNNLGSVSMYLNQGNERVGFIMLFPTKPVDISLCLCMEPALARYCADAEEFTANTSLRKSNHSIMVQLLSNEEVSVSVIEKLSRHLVFSSTAILLVFQSLVIQNYTFRRMLCSELEESDIAAICCDYDNKVVILTEDIFLENVLYFIQEHIPAQNTAVGISMPVPELELLSIAYQQCLFALGDTPQAGIRYCRDLAMPYLLQNLRNTPLSTHLLHPALGILKKYDEESETQLLETLRTFVRNSCRQSETAEQMHIHLNTLKYRLRRITELTGIDFKDYDELLYIQLSLAM